MFAAAFLLLPLAVVAVLWPRVVAFPVAALSGWLAISLLIKAYRLRSHRHHWSFYLAAFPNEVLNIDHDCRGPALAF